MKYKMELLTFNTESLLALSVVEKKTTVCGLFVCYK